MTAASTVFLYRRSAKVFHKIWILGENFGAGNCRGSNNHQGSAPKRGNRRRQSPRRSVRGTQSLQEHQDKQYKETKESLEPLVLSQLLVTFLWREKSPAGGITPTSTPSAKTEEKPPSAEKTPHQTTEEEKSPCQGRRKKTPASPGGKGGLPHCATHGLIYGNFSPTL